MFPGNAFVASRILAWKMAGNKEEAIERIWKRIAYATRYGRGCTMTEALELGQSHLGDYLQALGTIVEEENRANSGKR